MNLHDLPLSDLGNAERFIARYGADLLHNDACGWLCWDGARWRRDDQRQVERLAKAAVRLISSEAADLLREAVRAADEDRRTQLQKRVEALIAHARRSESAERLSAIGKLARSDEQVQVDMGRLDAQPYLLTCQNGTLDLRTGKLRAHQREDLSTRIVPIVFDPDAPAPSWEAFLSRVQPDPAIRAFLQRAAGYSLTGDTSEQTAFFLYGHGANGKSVFTTTLEFVLGGYATRLRSEVLMHSQRDAGGTTPDLERLPGARLAILSEIEEGARLRESFLKDLTGDERISVNPKYKSAFDFKPQFKPWLYGNCKPRFSGSDEGIRRRLPLVPFGVTIPREERDRGLCARLRQEGAGILAWALRGALAWQESGLCPPAGVIEATAEYHQEQDVFGQWLATCCALVPSAWTPTRDLRGSYESFCADNGFRLALDGNAFATRLRATGCQDKNGRSGGRVVRGWQGIAGLSEREETPFVDGVDTVDTVFPKTPREEAAKRNLPEMPSTVSTVSTGGSCPHWKVEV